MEEDWEQGLNTWVETIHRWTGIDHDKARMLYPVCQIVGIGAFDVVAALNALKRYWGSQYAYMAAISLRYYLVQCSDIMTSRQMNASRYWRARRWWVKHIQRKEWHEPRADFEPTVRLPADAITILKTIWQPG